MSLTTITTVFPPGGTGTLTIADTTALAIEAQTAAITSQMTLLIAELERTRYTMAGIVVQLGEIATQSQSTSKCVSDLNSALGSIKVAVADAATTQQSLAANIIKTNNFNAAVTKQALTASGQKIPEVPSITDQIKETVKDGFVMHQVQFASNYINLKITDTIESLTTWVTGMQVYQSIAGWLSKQKDAVLSVFNFKSPKTVAAEVAAIAGNSPTP
jgi:hypothetical protein